MISAVLPKERTEMEMLKSKRGWTLICIRFRMRLITWATSYLDTLPVSMRRISREFQTEKMCREKSKAKANSKEEESYIAKAVIDKMDCSLDQRFVSSVPNVAKLVGLPLAHLRTNTSTTLVGTSPQTAAHRQLLYSSLPTHHPPLSHPLPR
ncbi:hypothetical protein SCHPADRAFT_688635 [Schizopora paradoxa]|uniref:Uncharacterized protein n=1 Tax=Schizopora paradoxa TaxID=27342 RepID=A0A0H2RAK7_9AGAM|nr:hypothetical protein SCHPADRAFT_688635 [Schizopora paradoxa]